MTLAVSNIVSLTPANMVLRSLSPAALTALTPHLDRRRLETNRVLYEPGDRIDAVWFPIGAVLSQITIGGRGDTVESAMVGLDGVLGLAEALAGSLSSLHVVVQVDGEAFHVPAGVARQLSADEPGFMAAAWIATEQQLIETRQSTLCQAHHSVERRLARWLVDTASRSGGRLDFPMTQEFMAAMLGVQRTTVHTFAAQLQKAGLIRYSRGRLVISDLPGLAHRACDCLAAVAAHRRRLGLEPIAPADDEGQSDL